MSKYKVGNKVVLEISRHEGFYGFSDDNNTTVWIRDDHLDRCAKPLYTYTEPLEAEIRRQEAEITRLVTNNKRLKAENENGLWNIEQARAEGQNEAWELARKIVISTNHKGYSIEELNKIFGDRLPYSILANHNYPEAAAKVKAWKKAKENKRFDGSCDTCKFESTEPWFDPCSTCRHCYLSRYEPKEGEQE